jgi:hypothetical protein
VTWLPARTADDLIDARTWLLVNRFLLQILDHYSTQPVTAFFRALKTVGTGQHPIGRCWRICYASGHCIFVAFQPSRFYPIHLSLK